MLIAACVYLQIAWFLMGISILGLLIALAIYLWENI